MGGGRGKLIAVARRLSEPPPADIALSCDDCRALGRRKYGRPVCRRTGGDCAREVQARERGAILGSLSLPAAQAFAVFKESLTQINVSFGVVVGLDYPGVESVCRAMGAEWASVFPYLKLLERELLLKQNRPKKGSP